MTSENPYTPPSIDTDSDIPLIIDTSPKKPRKAAKKAAKKVQPASQAKRFVNFLLDGIVTGLLSYGAGFLLGFAYAMNRADPSAPLTPEDRLSLQVYGLLTGWAVAWLYYTITEALFQRSLAKFLTDTYVVNARGDTASLAQIMGRSLARFVPFEAFSFLGGDGYPVGWHDSLSGTRVIDIP